MNNNNNIRFEDLTGQGNGANPNQPIAPKNNPFNIASMVLGIVSIVAACCISEYIGIVCGILGIVFYVLTKKHGTANGMATAGLVCGIVGLALSILGILLAYVLLDALIEMYPELESMLATATNL